jgi:hypothetical protein
MFRRREPMRELWPPAEPGQGEGYQQTSSALHLTARRSPERPRGSGVEP